MRDSNYELVLKEGEGVETLYFRSKSQAINFCKKAGMPNKDACTLKSSGVFGNETISVTLKPYQGEDNVGDNPESTTDS